MGADGLGMFALLDWVIIGVALVSVAIGAARGLFREALSLVIWVAALIIASVFAEHLGEILARWVGEALRFPLAFGFLFLTVLIAGALMQKLVGMLVTATGLTGLDRLLGMLFGIARAFVLWVVLVAVLEPLFGPSEWWQRSLLVPHLLAAQEEILELLRQVMVSVATATSA